MKKTWFVNDNCFATLDESTSYWLGFLMADGCLDEHGYRILLSLSWKDRDHLIEFCRFVGCSRSPHQNKNGSLTVAFCSRPVYDRLNKLGITPRKSFTASAHHELTMNRHFWRGVVDGDGSLSFHQKTARSRDAYPVLSLVGSLALLSQFLAFLRHHFPQRHGRLFRMRNIWGFSAAYEPARQIVQLLYTDATVALERKSRSVPLFLTRPAPKIMCKFGRHLRSAVGFTYNSRRCAGCAAEWNAKRRQMYQETMASKTAW